MVKVLKPKGQVKRVEEKERPAKPQAKAPLKKKTQFDQREESLRTLAQFYLGEMDLKMRMRQMTIASGTEPPEWMATLEILKDSIIKTEHPDLKLKMYQGIVDLLAKVGQQEDLFIIQQVIARYNLKSFKDMGFEKVEVEVAKDACPVCRKMAGKRFRIEEAMESMPIPCHDCSTEVDEVKGYCRCRYFAVF
ncbi:MAG TPA: hypothetical protein PKJ15_03140 [Methanomassiliicoccales archaeon]|nr:hypothetical protein [Methanomassiliicoccales archaeon]